MILDWIERGQQAPIRNSATGFSIPWTGPRVFCGRNSTPSPWRSSNAERSCWGCSPARTFRRPSENRRNHRPEGAARFMRPCAGAGLNGLSWDRRRPWPRERQFASAAFPIRRWPAGASEWNPATRTMTSPRRSSSAWECAAARPAGQPGQVRRRGAGRVGAVPAAQPEPHLPRKGVGSRRRGAGDRRSRGPGHRRLGPATRFLARAELSDNRGIVATNGLLHDRVLDAVRVVLEHLTPGG